MLKHTEDQMIKATEMANAFIEERGEYFVEEFLEKSDMLGDAVRSCRGSTTERQELQYLKADYGDAIKRYFALCYSMGHVDAQTERPLPPPKPRAKPELVPEQLILPGMDKE